MKALSIMTAVLFLAGVASAEGPATPPPAAPADHMAAPAAGGTDAPADAHAAKKPKKGKKKHDNK